MSFAEVNGQRLHYRDTGGEGPVLVFSHGLLMDGSMWEPQIEELRGQYRCVSWDERGHGQTESDGEPFTYWDSADDLLALLGHLGVKRATLIGMSQGGYLTQRAAVKAPELIEGLVFVESQSRPEDPEKAGQYQLLVEAWAENGLGDELARTIAAIVIDPDWEGCNGWIEKWKLRKTGAIRYVAEPLFNREDFTGRLAELDFPALVIRGTNDLAISEDDARTLADGLPRGSLEIIEGAAHGANLTHPAEVNRMLREFLSRAAPAR